MLDSDEARRKFPFINVSSGEQAVYQSVAGYVNPRKLVRATSDNVSPRQLVRTTTCSGRLS